jgi:hypothetical protein
MGSVDWNGEISGYLKSIGQPPPGGAGPILDALGSACQASVEKKIGRTLALKDYIEVYTGNNKPKLFLRHDPIWTLASVSINGTTQTVQPSFVASPTFPLSTIAIDPGQEAIVLTNGDIFDASRPLNVIVAYSAGLAGGGDLTPPDDLVFAITYWASMLFRDRDRIGLGSDMIGGQPVGFDRKVPEHILTMIARRRRAFLPS